LFVVLLVMAPPSQELEPPAIPGRFTAMGSAFAGHAVSLVMKGDAVRNVHGKSTK
jgi:hypothetical protein